MMQAPESHADRSGNLLNGIDPASDRAGVIRSVDRFSPLAAQVRERALRLDFEPQEYKGHVYRGVGLGYTPPVFGEIATMMGCSIIPRLSFFRMGRRVGDELTVWIHADTSVPTRWASIWYLTPQHLCRGGTAFWRHRELGWHRLPAGGVDQAMADRLNAEGQDETLWDRFGLIRMAWNRFAVYPTDVFHSRFPREGWGETPDEARLIWVCFFDTVSG